MSKNVCFEVDDMWDGDPVEFLVYASVRDGEALPVELKSVYLLGPRGDPVVLKVSKLPADLVGRLRAKAVEEALTAHPDDIEYDDPTDDQIADEEAMEPEHMPPPWDGGP